MKKHAIYEVVLRAFEQVFDATPRKDSPQYRLYKAVSSALGQYEDKYFKIPRVKLKKLPKKKAITLGKKMEKNQVKKTD